MNETRRLPNDAGALPEVPLRQSVRATWADHGPAYQQENAMGTTSRTQQAEMQASLPSLAPAPRAQRRPGDLGRAILACLASGQNGYCEIGKAIGCRPSEVRRVITILIRTRAAPEQAAIEDCDRLNRTILAFLAVPRRICEVVRHTGAPRGTVRGQLDALVCAGLAAGIGKGLTVATGQPRVMPDLAAPPPPAPHRWRPQPIRDAILSFLGEPRKAREVAAHIGRPVSNAPGHLAAMRRRGLVARTGHGRYKRAEPLPGPVRPEAEAVLSLSSDASTGSGHGDTAAAVQDAQSGSILPRHMA